MTAALLAAILLQECFAADPDVQKGATANARTGGVLVDGTARLEGRTGARIAGQPSPDIGLAALTLSIQDDETAVLLRAAIAPQLLLANPGGGVVERGFVRGYALLELRDHPALRIQLRQDLGYGSMDISPLAGFPVVGPGPLPPGAQPPPPTPIVRLEEFTTTGLVEVALSRRTRLSADGAWQVSGGADQFSRASIPLARGPRLRTQLTHLLTPLDELDAELFGFDTRYSNGREVTVGNALIGWRDTLARGTRLHLAAGPSLARGVDLNGTARTSVLGVAQADISLSAVALGERGASLSARLAVEPVGDVVSGDLTERGGLTTEGTLTVVRGLTLSIQTSGSVALTSGVSGAAGTVRGDRYGLGELRASWTVAPQFEPSAGVRGAWYNRPPGGLPHTQWAAFVSFSFYPFRR
jgi:hypothetical protein